MGPPFRVPAGRINSGVVDNAQLDVNTSVQTDGILEKSISSVFPMKMPGALIQDIFLWIYGRSYESRAEREEQHRFKAVFTEGVTASCHYRDPGLFIAARPDQPFSAFADTRRHLRASPALASVSQNLSDGGTMPA